MKSRKMASIKELFFFVKNALTKPKQVGYIIPSSHSLIKSITSHDKLVNSKRIIELGPGTGGTTKGILKRTTKDTELVAIEIDIDFIRFLEKEIQDKRLHLIHDKAQNLKQIIKEQGWDDAEVIISGIPFSTITKPAANEIINKIYDNLKPGGIFISYQLRGIVDEIATPIFGKPIETSWVFKNVPPMRIFTWEK